MTKLEEAVEHHCKVMRTGMGLGDKAIVSCSCGWKGPWRYEADDYMSTKLLQDERNHLDNVLQMRHTS